jgi:hypothetical protein
MVDFEKMLAEKRAEKAARIAAMVGPKCDIHGGVSMLGDCVACLEYPAPSTPPRCVSIKATRTDCCTGQSREVTISVYAKASISPYLKGAVYLHLNGGPTGYESMPVDALDRIIEGEGWNACMGTDRRWDSLFVSASELARVKKELGL